MASEPTDHLRCGVVRAAGRVRQGRRAKVGAGSGFGGWPLRFAAMKLLRRALLALSIASVLAGGLRVRGKGGVPPQQGGWNELRVPPP